MSSDVIARVEVFAVKADELVDKGHVIRAAEYYGRAAEAARALGADNLVALHMKTRGGGMLCGYALTSLTSPGADARSLAAHRAESIALLSGAVAALERRRVAGTLLEGKCAAAEVAWSAARFRRRNVNMTAAVASSLAALEGVTQFLQAAIFALSVLCYARVFVAECSNEQFLSFVQHVVHAAEVMQHPRSQGAMALGNEASFPEWLRSAVAIAGANGLNARLVQLLAGAWQRLQRSGVLEAHDVENSISSGASRRHAAEAAVRRSQSAPGLRTCALPGCGAREAHPAHFKSCAACRAVVYCCREHQVAGWPGHKKACKASRKAAAAAEEDEAGPSGA